MAVSSQPGQWFLVNASPDLSRQIEAFPDLQPSPTSSRNTPIAGVLLTNADLDHVLGLFSLREGGPVQIHASAQVRRTTEAALGLETILNTFGGSRWHEPPRNDFGRLCVEGAPVTKSDLRYRAIGLAGKPPPFAREVGTGGDQSLAYELQDPRTGGSLVVAPDVAEVSRDLRAAMERADAVLFDGTFWSSEELASVRPNAAVAAEMGHVTIKDYSLELLSGLRSSKKIYIHINNTNPILANHSREHQAVEAAGITIGWDGLEFEL